MNHRFRFIASRTDDGSWCIAGEEFTHLRRVLRLGPGDRVEVTDTAGNWAEGAITGMAGQIAIVVAEDVFSDPLPAFRLALAVGALKPAAIDELLPSVVELGIDEIHIFGQDDVARFRVNDKARLRWEKITRAAIKQCRRSWLPEVHSYKNMDALVRNAKVKFPRRFVLTGATTATISSDDPAQHPGADTLAVIGGEKGFSPRELQLLAGSGFERRTLGSHVLRAVTAAVAGAAMLADYRLRVR